MTPRARALLPLAAVLLAALVSRLWLWEAIPRQGFISDEGEYLSAAWWLAHGRGFDWYQGYLWTRAPLYPLFLAAHLRLFGDALAPIAVTQTLLSLLNIALVYLLARRIAPPLLSAAPTIAALATAFYLPFAIYPQVLLSETLYISLLAGAFLALAHAPGRIARRHMALLAIAGLLFGLAALTRSLTLMFIPLAAAWIGWQARRDHWLRDAATFALAAALTIAPWTIYNSRIYGGLVPIDTSGAFNLLIGAWTAHDGQRRDAPTRDFVLALFPDARVAPPADTCLPHPGPQPGQAARQTAMTREGLCLIADRPLAFAQKSLVEFIDLFQINYTGAERFTNGFSTGRLPEWYVLALFLLDDTLYVIALPLALLGWALARRGAVETRPAHSLIGIWLAFNIVLAPLLFAINRFRLPLLPFVFILAAYTAVALVQRRGELWATLRGRFGAACATLAALLALVATAPYAYLEPRAPGADSRWASYLGPYPSSLEITQIALAARPRAINDTRFLEALQTSDFTTAEIVLASKTYGFETGRLGPALLAAHRGQYESSLALLPPAERLAATGDARGSVLRGDVLRSLGDEAGARAAFTPRYVDTANPVAWAWQWLRPAPTRSIDLGGNLDLGYINGCYLGEGDASERITYRWCTDGMQLRFPNAGGTTAQRLRLTVDGRGWPADLRPAPPIRVYAGNTDIGAFTPDETGVRMFELALPSAPEGADVVITLRGATFVPDAARYLSQQGAAVVGQVQRLMVRLDRAEIVP